MQKRFAIRRGPRAWEVLHNETPIRCCAAKREAIRIALTLGRMQRRLGDDSEITLYDEAGALLARHIIRSLPRPSGAPQPA